MWLILVPHAVVYADGMFALEHSSWRPMMGVGGGVAMTNNLGQNQVFPIVDPITEESYTYLADNQSQTAGLFEIFLGAEHHVLSNGLVQAGLAYTQSGTYKAQGILFQGVDAGSTSQYTYQYQVTAQELLAQAKLMRAYHDTFFPYVLVGIGGSFNRASSYTTNVPPYLAFTREYANNTSGSFAYRVGFGADVAVAQHARFGLARIPHLILRINTPVAVS